MKVVRFTLVPMFASLALVCGADRAFAQAPLFTPASGPPVIVARESSTVLPADINRDGSLDLVTKNYANQTVSVLLGNGRGGFTPSPTQSLHLDFVPGALALGDLNKDGALDLVVASKEGRNERVSIFLADRNGGFAVTSGSPLAAGLSAENCCYKPRLLLADLNGDGNLDLISNNGRRSALEIFFGDGRGGLSPRPRVELEAGRQMYSFQLADVDGDGHVDLVTASSIFPDSGLGHVLTRRGDGRGGFADAIGPTLSVLADPRVETVADLNGDHRPDIVLSHGRTNVLTILQNTGQGTFTAARNSPASSMDVGMPAAAVVAADVNGDKATDLIVATVSGTAPFASKIVVLLGDGHGEFSPAPGSPFAAAPGAYNLAVSDVSQDGKLDIVASSFEGNTVTILLHR